MKRLNQILILAAALVPALVPAQPYITNSAGPGFGAAQYNQNYPAPVLPGLTLTRQALAGINAFTGNTGTSAYATNAFATNTVYFALPAVTVQQFGGAAVLAQTNCIINLTATNCVLWFGGATNVNYSVIAIGH